MADDELNLTPDEIRTIAKSLSERPKVNESLLPALQRGRKWIRFDARELAAEGWGR